MRMTGLRSEIDVLAAPLMTARSATTSPGPKAT